MWEFLNEITKVLLIEGIQRQRRIHGSDEITPKQLALMWKVSTINLRDNQLTKNLGILEL